MFIDLVPSGLSPGDFFLFGANDLTLDNQLVGLASGRCVVLPDLDIPDNYYCTMELNFDDISSAIVLQGVFFELNVVSGTGCYQDLEGLFIPVQQSSGQQAFDFIQESDFFTTCTDVEPHIASPWIEPGGGNGWEYADWDQNDRSPGDIYAFDSSIFETALGMEGFLEGECMILVDTGVEKRFCTMTFLTGEFADSVLLAQGLFDNMVIVGGSGCFDGMTGTIKGSALPGGGFQYDLDLDSESSRGGPSCTLDIFEEIWAEDFGEDTVVEYVNDFDPGVTFNFDNNPVSVPSRGDVGVISGRCVILNNVASSYCHIMFELDEGTSAVQGAFTQGMTIVGGSGCFQGLKGSVVSLEESGNFLEYSWSISS